MTYLDTVGMDGVITDWLKKQATSLVNRIKIVAPQPQTLPQQVVYETAPGAYSSVRDDATRYGGYAQTVKDYTPWIIGGAILLGGILLMRKGR
jgi:hypothetical protein